MEQIKFDFNNMFSLNVGEKHGVTDGDLAGLSEAIAKAAAHLKKVLNNPKERIVLSLEWANLPFQDKETISHIQQLGDMIARKYKNVLFLGIGGSYLGLKAAQDALCAPYYNDFSETRKGRPRVYFEGNNLDPDTISVLLKNLNPKETFIIVISKSGETTETKVAFNVVEAWLKKGAGKNYGRQIAAITDPESGTLRNKVMREQAKDSLAFRSLPLLKGVGGRFSELNMGLLHLAVIGVKIKEVLAGAADMYKRCFTESLNQNPAYMYAALEYILYKKNKSIAVLMPFSETLKSTAEWYIQLLAESLGKKYSRKVEVDAQGLERWVNDAANIVNVGRTPIATRGTNDLHSVHQNNAEGENNKAITFIRVERFSRDIKIPAGDELLSGKKYSELLNLAEEATEWSLMRELRPNCAIIIPEITPFYWGALLFFFEIATAFEGELLNVNAFDQPGVESYKNYMYCKLNKPGLDKKVSEEISKFPLQKKPEYII
ncbi:MAG: glucose-6-phosphate isomerase [Candidatus Omnitrophota bacterium]